MTNPEIRADVRKAGLAAGQDNKIEALIRIRIPALPEADRKARPSLNLAFVIDRSGSMSGMPLHEACRCTLEMLGRLTPRDRAAIVIYDDKPEILVESRPVDTTEPFRHAIRMVRSGGSTNLHGGWELGRGAITAHATTETISRVLLLSDGRANAGIDDPLKIAAFVGEAAAQGVSTSTYGLGQHFNEDLMIEMGKRGGGRAAYGETAADLIEPYQEEFSLLDAIFGRKVRLRLKAAGGVPVEIVNGYERGPDGSVALPDLAHGAETWAVVRFTVLAATMAHAPVGADFAILESEVSFEANDGKRYELPTSWLALPVMSPEAHAGLPEDPLVRQRAGELLAAVFQDAAIMAAEQGDLDTVKVILAKAKAEAQGNPWVEAVLASLQELVETGDRILLIKEMKFSRTNLRNRSASLFERQDYSSLSEGDEAEFIRRKMRRGRREF
jgi:Ca-activated chloride channel family protein